MALFSSKTNAGCSDAKPCQGGSSHTEAPNGGDYRDRSSRIMTDHTVSHHTSHTGLQPSHTGHQLSHTVSHDTDHLDDGVLHIRVK
jgi:hypothetical protein